MNIYVGNIARESTDEEVKAVFDEFGTVESVNLIRDNYTKMLKGFGFIEMPSTEEAEKAIKSLDGQLFNGRPLIVNVAKPKTEGGSRNRSNSRGGGGYGGGGNSRGGGGGYGGGNRSGGGNRY